MPRYANYSFPKLTLKIPYNTDMNQLDCLKLDIVIETALDSYRKLLEVTVNNQFPGLEMKVEVEH